MEDISKENIGPPYTCSCRSTFFDLAFETTFESDKGSANS